MNFQKLQQFVLNLPADIRDKLLFHQLATGTRKCKVHFEATGTEPSAVGSGGTYVDCVPLDDILENESPLYIKMDIEGSEVDTLLGAQTIIRKETPILAISSYHHQEHLWRIPALISSSLANIASSYRPHNLEVWDLVCYAIPKNRLKQR